MKKLFLGLTLLFCALRMLAQDQVTIAPTRTFSLSASAVALRGKTTTVAATVLGGTFQITDKFSLRQDSILGQAGDFTGYYGGVEYNLPGLSKKLNAISQFDANHLQFYVTASVGIDRVPGNGVDVQHYSYLGGGGARYSPNGDGRFSVN